MGVGMGVVVHWGAATSSHSIQMKNEGLQSDLLLLLLLLGDRRWELVWVSWCIGGQQQLLHLQFRWRMRGYNLTYYYYYYY